MNVGSQSFLIHNIFTCEFMYSGLVGSSALRALKFQFNSCNNNDNNNIILWVLAHRCVRCSVICWLRQLDMRVNKKNIYIERNASKPIQYSNSQAHNL